MRSVIIIFSPLLIFLFHVVYLVVASPEPFFSKWVDGCLSFFLSLVLCNLIRARVAPSGVLDAPDTPPADHREDSGKNGAV